MAKAKKVSKKLSELLEPKPVWCDYADKTLVPKFIVHRFDDRNDNRFYYFLTEENTVVIASGVTYPYGKVSTEREAIAIWKEKHPNWRVLLRVSSEYGTSLHIIAGGIFLKKGVDTTLLEAMIKIATDNGQSADMPRKDALALLKFQEDYELRPLLVEAQLAYHDPITNEWMCLTIDLLTIMVVTEVTKTMVEDGVYLRGDKKGQPKMVEQRTETRKEKLMIGDLKSNFFEKEDKSYYETHKMQLIAGARAVEQNFGLKVDGVFNLSPKSWHTNPSYNYYEHNVIDEDNKIFDAYWNLIVAKRLNMPKGSLLFTEGFKDSNDYKLVSYQEYAEQILLPIKTE
jgi:hypothetical protein